MGLFGKAIRKATGIEGLERTIAKVRGEVAAGRGDVVTVGFDTEDAGRFNGLEAVTPRVVEALEEDGHTVLETTGSDADGRIELRVRRAV